MKIKKFKNGNINVLGYKDTRQECESLEHFIEILCDSIQLDYSFSTTDRYIGYELYNSNIDKMACISQTDFEKFKSGKIVKIEHYSYDKSDYEFSDIFEYLN